MNYMPLPVLCYINIMDKWNQVLGVAIDAPYVLIDYAGEQRFTGFDSIKDSDLLWPGMLTKSNGIRSK